MSGHTAPRKLAFIMPSAPYGPIGGFKVVYEYANLFAADGYQVTIVYPVISYWKNKKWVTRCKLFAKHLIGKVRKTSMHTQWFPLDKSVRELHVYTPNRFEVPEADVYVATAAQTARYVDSYRKRSKKIYFVQHFENWVYTDEEVIATYHYPLTKIVIARWLADIVENAGEKSTIIHNGFDFDYFYQTIPIEKKNKYCIAMLNHSLEWKGCQDGFDALEIVKQKYPELQVNLFGTDPRPGHLPAWYNYYRRPDQATHNRLYNEAAIFLGTSHTEGWGLTVGEAMMCGCAVVCTDNDGYREMAANQQTALVSPIKNPRMLAENMIRLIEDDRLRMKIAEAGYKHIRRFTWDESYKRFKSVVEDSDN